jgi:hypothetical protein
MHRRGFLACASTLSATSTPAWGDAVDVPHKVLRYAFALPETGFDPAQVIDIYSRAVIAA